MHPSMYYFEARGSFNNFELNSPSLPPSLPRLPSHSILISTFPAPSSTPLLSTSSSDSRTSFILTTRPQPSPSLPPNPCSLYFLNVLIDTTFGVILIAYLLKLAKYVLVDKLQLEGFDMGVYKDGKRWNCWVCLTLLNRIGGIELIPLFFPFFLALRRSKQPCSSRVS